MLGLGPSENGGVIAPTSVRGAGTAQWSDLTGIHPGHPLVSEAGGVETNPGYTAGSRIVTTPLGNAGPATDVIATPDGTGTGGLHLLDDWRDVFNFKGSAVPWLLIIIVAAVFFAHASIEARAGAFGRDLSTRAALE